MPRRMRQTSFLSAISSLPTCGHPPLQQASEKRYYSLKVIQGMVDEWGGRPRSQSDRLAARMF